jgi:hypothetical protein
MKSRLKSGTHSYSVLSSNDRWPPGVLLYALQEAPRSGIERSDMNSKFALKKEQVQICDRILTRNARPACNLVVQTIQHGAVTQKTTV